jgi:hypothetical protein
MRRLNCVRCFFIEAAELWLTGGTTTPAGTVLNFNDPIEHQQSVANGDVRQLIAAPGFYQGHSTHRVASPFMQRGPKSPPSGRLNIGPQPTLDHRS